MARSNQLAGPSAQRHEGLAKRPYPQIWIAQTVNYFGDQVYVVALPWLVYNQTGSGAAMTLCFAAGMIPYIYFGVMGGVSSDRGQRRRVLIAGNAVAAIAVAAMFIVGTLNVRAPDGWDIIVFALILAAATSFAGSAAESAIPLIFESAASLQRANSYMELSNSVSQVAGPALAGILIAAVSASGALAADAASFAFACAVFVGMGASLGTEPRHAETERASARSAFTEWSNGVKYALQNETLRAGLTLSTCSNLALGGVDTLLVLILRTRNGLPAEGVAAVLAVAGLGAVLCAGVVLPRAHLRFPGRVMVGAILISGVTTLVIGEMRSVSLTVVCSFCYGGATTAFNVVWRTLRQREARQDMLGRVAGACRGIAYCGAALGALCDSGLLALGVPATTLFCAAGIVVVVMAARAYFGVLPRWREAAVQPGG